MSRKQTTTFHFNVKIIAPTGTNGAMIQQYLREAIISHKGGFMPDDPMTGLHEDDFTVALTKKETTYAQR